MRAITAVTLFVVALSTPIAAANANSYREKGQAAKISGSILTVTPSRDWNKLGVSPGKKTETWTLDGEELNDVTFFAGIEPGKPLVREVSKKRKPLPKFTEGTLLLEVPELLEGTYRAAKDLATFTISGSQPDRFLGSDGIRFTFDYVDNDALPRRGEGRAALINGLLYMAVFDAPRLNYYDRTLSDFRTLTDSAKLN
ncbi:hypothetical protein [Sphingomonas sp.]|jgi:hypothetical protein|uniref:hypothetical protein n=1 Tax=Sphingomonas sp. TaxID=28214 RepID=UPI00260DB9B0|nr:hypothetical protein [Sphingomonas sp.]MDF2496212.1 hypothetical protein [Sphingomonas sp.]